MYAQSFHREVEDISLPSVATLVLWLSCLVVGIAGLRLRYPRPEPEFKPPPPVVAQVMHVELANDASPAPPDIGPPQITARRSRRAAAADAQRAGGARCDANDRRRCAESGDCIRTTRGSRYAHSDC